MARKTPYESGYDEWDYLESFLYNNPYNIYGMLTSSIEESGPSIAMWQGIPLGVYTGVTLAGGYAAGAAGAWAVPTMVGMSLMSTIFLFGAVSAAGLIYDVKTDPVKEAAMQEHFAPGEPIFKMTGFGSVV